MARSPSIVPRHATDSFVALTSRRLTRREIEDLYVRLVTEIGYAEQRRMDAGRALERLLRVIQAATGGLWSRQECLNIAERAALDVAETRR